jgi:hypothetical protein
MNSLTEAEKFVDELAHDASSLDTDAPVDALPPSEEPVSDDAVGADTEGNVALQLLSDIRDLVQQLVGGDESELPPEEDAEEGTPLDAVPEAPEEEENDLTPGGARPEPQA